MTVVSQAYLDQLVHVADSTHDQRCITLRAFLEYLGTVATRGPLLPEMMTRAGMTGFYRWLIAGGLSGRGVRPLKARQDVYTIRRMWLWAWEHETWGEYFARPVSVDLPDAQPECSARAPSWAQVDEAIAVARRGGRRGSSWYGDALEVSRYTGLRIGQVMRLEWADLDATAALLRIRPELGKSRGERRGRTVPLSSHLVASLTDWRRSGGFIVTSPTLRRRLHYGTLRRIWRTTGVPSNLWRQPTHCARRAFVSGLTHLRVRGDVIAALVGHRAGITRDVYTDPVALLTQMRDAVALIPRVGSAS